MEKKPFVDFKQREKRLEILRKKIEAFQKTLAREIERIKQPPDKKGGLFFMV